MKTLAIVLALVALPALCTSQTHYSICELQAYDEDGLSPHRGEFVVSRGAVTFPPGYLNPMYTSFYIENGGCGVNVFCFDPLPFTLSLGDSVEVVGDLVEYISGTGAGGCAVP